RLFDCLREARSHLWLILQAVDNDLDVVLDLAIELQIVGQLDNLAIDTRPQKTTAEHVLKEVLVLALLAAHDRGEDKKATPFRQGENARDDLVARLGRDGPATGRTVAQANAGIEDA